MVSLPIGMTRKCMILGTSITPLCRLPHLQTSFLKGMMAATMCVTSTTVVKIMLKSNERTQTKQSRIMMAMGRSVHVTLIALNPRMRKSYTL